MHELSLAAGMLDQIAALVKNKTDLKTVHITIGPLAGIFAESLEFGFTELARADGYLNVVLVITKVPARLKCEQCTETYESDRFDVVCPQCGSMQRTVLSGKECSLDSLELEEEDV
jgi:hydrogenase nickel incorporation protein HypA/HybF